MPVADVPCDRCGHLRWFRLQELDDSIILNILPSMDPERVDVQRAGRMIVHFQSPPRIIVNLSLIEWIGSTFTNEMVRLLEIVKDAQGKLFLCGMRPFVQEVLRVTKLETLFDSADDENIVLDELSK